MVSLEVGQREEEKGPDDQGGGRETVLIVEDDEGVRNLARRILLRAGYNVLAAADGNEAMGIIIGDIRREVRLMLTDIVMPGMSGVELARRVSALRPGLKVIYMSGSLDIADNEGTSEFRSRFIGKPFDTASLAGKIREALDRGAGNCISV